MLFGINRHNSSLILFDRFSLANYNSTTFATSGAGKSYAIKLEVIRSLMIGIDVIVIDPEREFEKIAIATGGRYFNISLTSEHSKKTNQVYYIFTKNIFWTFSGGDWRYIKWVNRVL